MKHPKGRAERRFNGNVWRNRQRAKMALWWKPDGRDIHEYWQNNRTWWARKQSFAHGSRCMCYYEKHSKKYKRKRRRALKEGI